MPDTAEISKKERGKFGHKPNIKDLTFAGLRCGWRFLLGTLYKTLNSKTRKRQNEEEKKKKKKSVKSFSSLLFWDSDPNIHKRRKRGRELNNLENGDGVSSG